MVDCTVDHDDDGVSRTVTLATGMSLVERVVTNDPIARRFQYRITGGVFTEHLGTVDVIDLGDDTCLGVYSTDAVPDVMALVIGGATGDALRNIRDLVEGAEPGDPALATEHRAPAPTHRPRRSPADGPQDPVRHHRPAALRHPRLQRRDTRPHTGRRRARRAGNPLRTRRAPVGGVHAVALDHAHRPAPGDPRGLDERRAPPGRRPVGGDGAAPLGVPHRPDRQGPLRAVPGPTRALHREPPRRPRRADRHCAPVRPPARPAPGLRAPAVRHARRRRLAALRPVARGEPPRGGAELLPGARRRPRGQRRRLRRHGRTPGAAQPDPTRLVPHRLGRTAHDRLARRARCRRRLVLLDELPGSAPPVGSARVRAAPRRLATGRPSRRLPGRAPPSANASSTTSHATGASGTTASSWPTTRRRRTGCRRR